MFEIIEFEPNLFVKKTMINKTTGNIDLLSYNVVDGLSAKISPFDSIAQIIDGKADIIFDGKSHLLSLGQSVVIPANTTNIVKAEVPFKMIQTDINN